MKYLKPIFKMRAISLFSGAMGLDQGLEKAGFKICVANEIEPAFVETIRSNTKIPVIDRDINDVTAKEIFEITGLGRGDFDLVAGGPPCQPFSTAGAQRSISDERGNVMLSYIRLIKDIQPKTFLLENVRGLLYARIDFVPDGFNKEDYKSVMGEKGSLIYFLYKEFEKIGYKVSFALFDSANYGVPQKRERILMFGSKLNHEVELPKPTHDKDGVIGKRWITLEEALKGLKEKDMDYVEFQEKHKKYLKKLKTGQYWKHLPEKDQMRALGGSYKLQGGKTGFYRRLGWKQPSPTLVTSPIMPATMLCHPEKLRPLSVQEYARIQQFPDNWKIAGSIRDQYKQIGNAVPVGLGYVAGKALINHLSGCGSCECEHPVNTAGYRFSRYKKTDHKSFLEKLEKISQPSLL